MEVFIVKTSPLIVIASLALGLPGCWGSENHLDGSAPEADLEDPQTDEILEPMGIEILEVDRA